MPAGPEGLVGEGALRRLGAGRAFRRRVGPALDRSARLFWAVGVMTEAELAQKIVNSAYTQVSSR
ncbi:hypothetical protein OHT76_36010 [Streptomyces sp. NBC_00287]|uniref:hypothetical protein n=1 Tax=Streptomyces sp. NBC_00287 TaxID=2975702 RepID=UPI002E2D5840|nr:hypothetical protein [Streptomyces sp. NBC_00287]